jgi:S1-C subfamily serine protease
VRLRARLQEGDIIVAYADKPLRQSRALKQLRRMIVDSKPDQVVPMQIVRDGKKMTVEVTVGKRPLRP